MIETIRAVFSLMLSYGLLLLANGMFGTLIGLRTRIEGFSTETVGVIAGFYFLGLLIGARQAVRVVAAVGHIRSFAAFASIMSTTALLHVLWVDPIAWGAFRLVAGFCMAGMVMVTESWLNERTDNARRGQVMSLYMMCNYLAAGCGQFIVPLGDPGAFELFCVASIVYSVALVPVLVTRSSAPRPLTPGRMPLGALWRTSPLGFAGAACAGMVNASFFGLSPVYASEIGLSIPQVSAFIATVVFGGLLLQWHVGRLWDRFDRRWVLIGVTGTTMLSCVAMVLASTSLGRELYLAAALYGGLSFTIYSIAMAHTNDFADPDRRVETASGLLLAYGCGAFVGPMVAGTIMGQLGPAGLFIWSAGVNAALALFALYRMFKRATVEPEGRAPLVSLPGGQHTSGVLYRSLRDQTDRDLAGLSGRRRRPPR